MNEDREFIEIIVDYPAKCYNPHFKDGDPYYQIHYKEKEQDIVGYGTYNIKVFSEYIREFCMREKVNSYHIYFKTRSCLEQFQELYFEYPMTCSKVVNKTRYRKMSDICKWLSIVQCTRADWENIKKTLDLKSEPCIYSYSHGRWFNGWVYLEDNK